MSSLERAAAVVEPLKAAYLGFDLYHISKKTWGRFCRVSHLRFVASSGVRQSSQRAPLGLPFRPTQVTKWFRSSLRSLQPELQMLQVIVVFVLRPVLTTVRGFFLYICPPCGIFEAITTPLTLANCFSKSGVMAKDFSVYCVLRDMTKEVPSSIRQDVRISNRIDVRVGSGKLIRRRRV